MSGNGFPPLAAASGGSTLRAAVSGTAKLGTMLGGLEPLVAWTVVTLGVNDIQCLTKHSSVTADLFFPAGKPRRAAPVPLLQPFC